MNLLNRILKIICGRDFRFLLYFLSHSKARTDKSRFYGIIIEHQFAAA